ncbi:protein Ex13L [Neisseria animaloris]|uniref:Protein Ex13L n=1 Tax=Neisseria animaloris TaxID=326522 RepID=A0A1X3CH88_9NEIS|nr:Slam-dependent surface lipoprotein [Neisseria animaloris]MDO5073820.1 Slam-dependent surface lipoprotein [Neisseria animaloris]OSI06926.1 hypothetical protein BWD08_09790 [Neisseria animaloris]VEH88040.1 protein Ex13L [Neisseria animaloris]VEJ21925.1 protein Ex13L [Neisseria animaloris]
MKIKRILTACTLVSALAACSGSGGSPNTHPTNTTLQQSLEQMRKQSNKQHQNLTDITGVYQSTSIRVDGSLKRDPIIAPINNIGSVHTLQIGRTVVDLIPAGADETQPVIRHISKNEHLVLGNNLKHAAYGWHTKLEPAGGATGTLFFQGKLTPSDQMPEKGTAVYNGLALYTGKDSVTGNVLAHIEGKSTFNVNFADNTVKGNISANNREFETAHFNADIKGNLFTSREDAANKIDGLFYGPNAAEMAGIFSGQSGTNHFKGVFGAKK